PVLIAQIDRWAQDFLVYVEQAEDATAAYVAHRDSTTQKILASLPPGKYGAFADKLERERDSREFIAEMQKVQQSPLFQALEVVYAPVSGLPVPEAAPAVVEKAVLGRISAMTRDPQRLDRQVTQAAFVPQALIDMGAQTTAAHIRNQQWPFKISRNEGTYH